MKRKLLCVLAALLTTNILSAVELVPTQQLLASYLEQDSDLKNLALELKKAKLNQQSTEIDKGFKIKLSTGDMTMTLGDNNSSPRPNCMRVQAAGPWKGPNTSS